MMPGGTTSIALGLVAAVAMPLAAASDLVSEGDRLHAADRIGALRTEAASYEHGEGVPRDSRRAIERYCEAAHLGDAEAQFSLGWIYANGRGVRRDDGLAALFFGLAAEQGHPQAQAMRRLIHGPPAGLPACMRDPEPVARPEAVAAAPTPPEPEPEYRPANPEQKKVVDLVNKIAPEFQVSPLLALAVIRAESNFDPQAVSPRNAQGLMQLIPETAARFNVKRPFDPVQNIRGGLAYLRWLLAYFEGDVALVAAAYNAGEGVVERYAGIPPFAETRAYVQRILRVFRKPVHPYDGSVTDPSPELPRIRNVSGS